MSREKTWNGRTYARLVELLGENGADNYVSWRPYGDDEPVFTSNCSSWTSIEVLEFLKGLKWDDIARSYVAALRPSEIRVSTGLLKSNSVVWRVTIMVDDANTITEITQEVEVPLPEGVQNGYELACALDKARALAVGK